MSKSAMRAAVLRGFQGPEHLRPQVKQHHSGKYYASTPNWEGPFRHDYPAAQADLEDRLKAKGKLGI